MRCPSSARPRSTVRSTPGGPRSTRSARSAATRRSRRSARSSRPAIASPRLRRRGAREPRRRRSPRTPHRGRALAIARRSPARSPSSRRCRAMTSTRRCSPSSSTARAPIAAPRCRASSRPATPTRSSSRSTSRRKGSRNERYDAMRMLADAGIAEGVRRARRHRGQGARPDARPRARHARAVAPGRPGPPPAPLRRAVLGTPRRVVLRRDRPRPDRYRGGAPGARRRAHRQGQGARRGRRRRTRPGRPHRLGQDGAALGRARQPAGQDAGDGRSSSRRARPRACGSPRRCSPARTPGGASSAVWALAQQGTPEAKRLLDARARLEGAVGPDGRDLHARAEPRRSLDRHAAPAHARQRSAGSLAAALRRSARSAPSARRPRIIDAPRSGKPEERIAAISGLATMDDPRASQQLANLMRDPDLTSRRPRSPPRTTVARRSTRRSRRSSTTRRHRPESLAASQLRTRGTDLDDATGKANHQARRRRERTAATATAAATTVAASTSSSRHAGPTRAGTRGTRCRRRRRPRRRSSRRAP